MTRNDAIFRETRWASWVVVAVLLPALVVLWGFPGHTEDFWSWPIAAETDRVAAWIFLGGLAALAVAILLLYRTMESRLR